jgi:hypothetical protein
VVPPDPNGVLTESHGARELLANDALVIIRSVAANVDSAERY